MRTSNPETGKPLQSQKKKKRRTLECAGQVLGQPRLVGRRKRGRRLESDPRRPALAGSVVPVVAALADWHCLQELWPQVFIAIDLPALFLPEPLHVRDPEFPRPHVVLCFWRCTAPAPGALHRTPHVGLEGLPRLLSFLVLRLEALARFGRDSGRTLHHLSAKGNRKQNRTLEHLKEAKYSVKEIERNKMQRERNWKEQWLLGFLVIRLFPVVFPGGNVAEVENPYRLVT